LTDQKQQVYGGLDFESRPFKRGFGQSEERQGPPPAGGSASIRLDIRVANEERNADESSG
jgi:hypothetical protein